MNDGLCQYPGCWRFPYLTFNFCIKHKCQNHRCNGYKIPDFAYCSFHKCSYEFACPNSREFLRYHKGPSHLPIYSKFCAVHNRAETPRSLIPFSEEDFLSDNGSGSEDTQLPSTRGDADFDDSESLTSESMTEDDTELSTSVSPPIDDPETDQKPPLPHPLATSFDGMSHTSSDSEESSSM